MNNTIIDSALFEEIQILLERFIKVDAENSTQVYYLQAEAFDLLKLIQNKD